MVQERSNPAFRSEELVAYELGYRVKPVQKVSIDSTAFINEYNKLGTIEPGALDGIDLPYYFSNLGKGRAYGFETSVTWDVTSKWNLLANYSYINLLLDQNPASQDPIFLNQSGAIPHHQAMLRSQLFLPHDVRLVNALYYVDRLPSESINSYVRFDTQVIWQAMSGLELALTGQNLLDNKHPEFGATLGGAVNEIPRAFYGRITLRY
jgi:iron complex outermembrane receptor protein